MTGQEQHEPEGTDKVAGIVVKMLLLLRSRFACNDEADIDGGFLFTDPADGTTYELRIREFDPTAWLEADQ